MQTNNLERLQAIALAFPSAERKDVEAWDGAPTFRVGGKNFVFTSLEGSYVTVKLPVEEATALVATREDAEPMGYGLGRHGWVTVTLAGRLPEEQWDEVAEWVEQSYRLVAPRRLVRELDAFPG